MTDLVTQEDGHYEEVPDTASDFEVEYVTPQVGVVDHSGLGVSRNPRVREIARALSTWVEEGRRPGRASLLDRRGYLASDSFFDELFTARVAMRDDDCVSGLADVTEGLIFQATKWEAEDGDLADVFNQISAALDMDAYMRTAYRELMGASQVVTATQWGYRTFKVRGRTAPPPPEPVAPAADGTIAPPVPPRKGRPRRKVYADLWVPTAITVLDSSKVIPVGNQVWGRTGLAWHATQGDMDTWARVESEGGLIDPTMDNLILGPYRPGRTEADELIKHGVDPKALLLLDPARVWRHTLTMAPYQIWPDNRMRSIFRHLDLKQQLMDADRVQLVGAANYILLVKKGSDAHPGTQEEVTHLKENFRTVAKLPVIVSDHRLDIEIITPKVDLTLSKEKYDVLDERIIRRLLGAFVPEASSNSRNASGMGRMVSRLLESRRHMLKRSNERHIAASIMALNPQLSGEVEPNFAYVPARVEVGSDMEFLNAVMAARTRNELSRETYLETLGFDQEVELQRIMDEREYADLFFQTHTPFDSPAGNNAGLPPGSYGSTGGRPRGASTSEEER